MYHRVLPQECNRKYFTMRVYHKFKYRKCIKIHALLSKRTDLMVTKSIPLFRPPQNFRYRPKRKFTPISKWGQSMSSNCRSLPMQQLRSGRPPVNKPHCPVSFLYFKSRGSSALAALWISFWFFGPAWPRSLCLWHSISSRINQIMLHKNVKTLLKWIWPSTAYSLDIVYQVLPDY